MRSSLMHRKMGMPGGMGEAGPFAVVRDLDAAAPDDDIGAASGGRGARPSEFETP